MLAALHTDIGTPGSRATITYFTMNTEDCRLYDIFKYYAFSNTRFAPCLHHKEITMTFKIIALAIIALLLVTDYALMVMAHRADERAERMYKRWQDERSNNQTKE